MSSRALEGVVAAPASHEIIDVVQGLTAQPKRLPCRLFYDEVGSRLFEQICETPEYYPTRTELGILRANAPDMLEGIGANATLIEWGSGASVKTRVLLSALPSPKLYVPIDISEEILTRSTRRVEQEYPGLLVRPVVGDYLRPLHLPLSEAERAAPIVTFFPGSTLGNFEPESAVAFLANVRKAGGRRQRFLLGTDLPKSPEVLEAAYDDRAGVTARFNLNILRVLNRRFDATFDVHGFSHRAVFNADAGRVEMQLVSRRKQSATVLGWRFDFAAGEPIVTEHCYKFSLAQLADMATRAGFELHETWTDDAQRFAVHQLRPV